MQIKYIYIHVHVHVYLRLYSNLKTNLLLGLGYVNLNIIVYQDKARQDIILLS